jgi:hypothetical protein
MNSQLLVALTEHLHRRLYTHPDPESGLSRDCETCQREARTLVTIFVTETMRPAFVADVAARTDEAQLFRGEGQYDN